MLMPMPMPTPMLRRGRVGTASELRRCRVGVASELRWSCVGVASESRLAPLIINYYFNRYAHPARPSGPRASTGPNTPGGFDKDLNYASLTRAGLS